MKKQPQVNGMLFKSDDLANLNKTGVYKIFHVSCPENIYIGSTRSTKAKKRIGFYGRFVCHLAGFKNKKHHSYKLLDLIDKNGLNGIRFEIIEICAPKIAREREQFYLDTMSPTLNVSDSAFFSRYKKSNELKEKISCFFKNLHRKHEWYENVRSCVFSVDINGVVIKKYNSVKEAAIETNTDRASISNAAAGRRKSAGGIFWTFNPIAKIDRRGKIIRQTDMNGNHIKTFYTLEQIKKELGISSSTSIRACILGRQNRAYGYKWVQSNNKEARENGWLV